ncbi:MAG: adenylate/guanylate cyclase domain-containing protein [Nannocystaceae bacterium]
MSDPLLAWLLSDAQRHLDGAAFIEGLAGALEDAGVATDRVWLGYIRPHPLVAGVGACWERERGAFTVSLPIEQREVATAPSGPIDAAIRGSGPVRVRLDQLERGAENLKPSLWDRGYVEIVVLGLRWAEAHGEQTAVITFATRRPGGYTDAEVARVAGLRGALSLHAELLDRRLSLDVITTTYLGRDAGRRVLDGAIHRGDGETITAAIWFSDLRGFTALSERLPLSELLELLDDAFQAQVMAIERRGGEVLKFIGDGMLAIFRGRTDDGLGAEEAACAAALAATRDLEASIAATNDARAARGAEAIRYGVALHYGDVLYGNIGAKGRLDFTVIGPAVNLAARLEPICGQLGIPAVASADFAARCPEEVTPAGEFSLKGLSAPVEVFLVPSASSARP